MEKNQKLEQYIDELRAKKIRITDQRVAILKYLIEVRNHPTARDIYDSLKDKYPNMSVATVYNNLETFVNVGFVMSLHCGGDSTHFDLADHVHYHAICENCGKIFDFEYPQLHDVQEQVSRLTGFKVNSHRLEVFGICPDCQEKLDVKTKKYLH